MTLANLLGRAVFFSKNAHLKNRMMKSPSSVLALVTCAALAACGGGGDGGANVALPTGTVGTTATSTVPDQPPAAVAGTFSGTASLAAVTSTASNTSSGQALVVSGATNGTLPSLVVAKMELAQTHVIPPAGRAMVAPSQSVELHEAGGRQALALVTFAADPGVAVSVEGLNAAGTSLGSVVLSKPSSLPPTEAHGVPYASTAYSAVIPASWMQPGLQLRATGPAATFSPSSAVAVKVGADTQVGLKILPFYLFGANDSNTFPLSEVGIASDAVAEALAKWPIGSLNAGAHPAGRVTWPQILVPPRTDTSGIAQSAYVLSAADQQQDSFAVINTVLAVLGTIKLANGDSPGPGPVLQPAHDAQQRRKISGPSGRRRYRRARVCRWGLCLHRHLYS